MNLHLLGKVALDARIVKAVSYYFIFIVMFVLVWGVVLPISIS